MVNSDFLIKRHGSGIRLLLPEDTADKRNLPTLQEAFNLPVNIYLMNGMSQYQQMNEQTVESCGFVSIQDALGNNIRKVAKSRTAEAILRNDRHVMRVNQPLIKYESFVGKNDEEISGISFKFPWFTGDEIFGVFGCTILTNDHTQMANALEQLSKSGILWQDEATDALSHSGRKIGGIDFNRREIGIMRGIIYGYTVKEIGKQIGLSHRTVEHYLEKIRFKTKLNSRPELIRFFIDHII